MSTRRANRTCSMELLTQIQQETATANFHCTGAREKSSDGGQKANLPENLLLHGRREGSRAALLGRKIEIN